MGQPVDESKATGSWTRTWEGLVSADLTKALLEIGTLRRLADREALYQRGDPGNQLVGVRSGALRLAVVSPDGAESVAGIYGAGTWFGEVSLFDERPRPTGAYSVGTTEVLLVPSKRVLEILDGHPQWYRDFARVLCNKLRLALTHIEGAILPTSVRVGLRLLDLSMGRNVALRLSQEDLGRMLGLTRQSINKELRAFEDCGFLEIRRGELVLLDCAALRRHIVERGGADLLAS